MKHLKRINEYYSGNCVINVDNLKKFALGIELVCNGEYGIVFLNEGKNAIHVCLGDSHPFDNEYLKDFILEGVLDDWKNYEKVSIIIENECHPEEGPGWKVFIKGDFKPWDGKF